MAGDWTGFIRCSEASDQSSATPTWRVDAESVAGIGFVARGAVRGLAPIGDRERIGDRMGRAVEALMVAGNATPPSSFDDERGFVETLQRRDHRGAIAIVEPRLWLDGAGVPLRVDFHILEPRLGAGYVCGAEGTPEHNIGPAVDLRRHRVEFAEDHVLVQHWQRYGLDNPLDLDGRFEPDSPPPFAFIALAYRVYVDGRAEVSLAASYLPSCWFYRDWMRCHRRDMRRATADEVEATLAPRREKASGTTFATVELGRGILQASREAGA